MRRRRPLDHARRAAAAGSAAAGATSPGFEIFTSPDWRGTEGWIRFSEPLYVFGSLVRGVEVHFKDGVVSRIGAAEGDALVKEMVKAPGADRIGEFSLTDARLSPIDHFMATTLFDENTGGPFGNTHLALGMSLTQCYDGDPSQLGGRGLGRARLQRRRRRPYRHRLHHRSHRHRAAA